MNLVKVLRKKYKILKQKKKSQKTIKKFSFNVNIYHTDAHPILDAKTNKIINKVKSCTIGNHVWLSANSTILKNAFIEHDCIVGWGSVVSGKFSDPFCAIASNPARVVKSGITWDSNGSKGYVQNEG